MFSSSHILQPFLCKCQGAWPVWTHGRCKALGWTQCTSWCELWQKQPENTSCAGFQFLVQVKQLPIPSTPLNILPSVPEESPWCLQAEQNAQDLWEIKRSRWKRSQSHRDNRHGDLGYFLCWCNVACEFCLFLFTLLVTKEAWFPFKNLLNITNDARHFWIKSLKYIAFPSLLTQRVLVKMPEAIVCDKQTEH